MPDASGLTAMALAFFVVAASPGPANLAVSTVSMSAGRRSGLQFGLGLTLGLAAWGLVAATGLGAILQASANALLVLKLLGGLYLLWLAIGSARAAAVPQPPSDVQPQTSRWLIRGLVLNLSNPKAVVAWLAALAIGIDTAAGPAHVAGATLICMLIGLGNYMAYALVFSTPRMMRLYARVRRWIDGVVVALFAAAGLGLIRSALARAP